jgi:hypothetical protein
MSKTYRPVYSVPGLATLLAPTAQAAVVEYTDRASWLAATSNTATINFSNLYSPPSGSFLTLSSDIGVLTSRGAVGFDSPSDLFWVVSPDYQPNTLRPLPNPLVGVTTWPGQTVGIVLPAGIKAFGMDFYATSDYTGSVAERLTIQFLSHSWMSPFHSVPETLFSGFVSTDDIPAVAVIPVIQDDSRKATAVIQTFSLGDAATGGAETVPEPATWALVAGGALPLTGWRRRKL